MEKGSWYKEIRDVLFNCELPKKLSSDFFNCQMIIKHEPLKHEKARLVKCILSFPLA